jgi:NADH:ubiquinone oxidoreductase subunit
MTTKTIPAYLQDERQKSQDDLLRMEAEAARIQPLRHGHHRTAKQPERELLSPIEVTRKKRKTATANRKKPRVARKTATKARKIA